MAIYTHCEKKISKGVQLIVSNRDRGVFHVLIIEVGVMLLEKCGQAAAGAVFAVVPHEVPAGRIRVHRCVCSQLLKCWPHVILTREELARDAGLHVVPAAQDVAIHQHWHVVTNGLRDDTRRGICHIRHKQEAALLHFFLERVKFQERNHFDDAVALPREFAIGAPHEHAS